MAGAYAFGMTTEQARTANVDTARRVVRFAATLANPARLVHLSGYRVGRQDPATVPWSPNRIAYEYRRLGAYEASKVESDAVVQALAATLNVRLTIVNPSTVIGDSLTGESPQTLGLAATILDLLRQKPPGVSAAANGPSGDREAGARRRGPALGQVSKALGGHRHDRLRRRGQTSGQAGLRPDEDRGRHPAARIHARASRRSLSGPRRPHCAGGGRGLARIRSRPSRTIDHRQVPDPVLQAHHPAPGRSQAARPHRPRI